ncbi:efflux transporter outer membrane subunit [Sphingomonas lycopersici]|uniref:Efflux transporter outer membrane subunit n=1 Tax=Sphingomonas lycopersici TaxID=2951807 RepID=A0AA42CSU3_9SPHN|nr:efflux transporter outer membrane subunit [Sphingomonas lycopersici]
MRVVTDHRASLRAVALALLLSGCVSVPSLGPRPEMRATQSFAADQSLAPAVSPAATWPDGNWWRGYGDAQLSTLIEEGLSGAPDITAAIARLRQADGYHQQAGAALLPRVDAQAQAGGAKQSYNNGIPAAFVPKGWKDTGSAALDFSFDLDLWGKNRANLRAATSDADAAAIDVAQARLLLATNIASAYADLARLFAERDVQADAVASRVETQKLVADRVAVGLDTRAELKQADAAVPAERTQLSQIDESIALTRNRLAALIGKGPDRGLAIGRPTLSFAARSVPADVTTDLIGRRPDIVSARARVEASAARIKAARADFYPSVSLTALVGFQSLGLSNLFVAGSHNGQAAAAVSLPIFHGGEIRGKYRVARASYDEAVASYDGAVATAFHDVADAVTSQSMLGEQLAQSRQSLADAREAYAVAKLRYQGGLSNYLSVLTAQNSMLQQQRVVVDLEARAFTLDVALVRALGGGAVAASPSPVSAAAGAVSKDKIHG